MVQRAQMKIASESTTYLVFFIACHAVLVAAAHAQDSLPEFVQPKAKAADRPKPERQNSDRSLNEPTKFSQQDQLAFNQTLELRKSGDAKGAIAIFDRLALKYPRNSLIFYARGLTYFNLTSYDNAIADISKAIELAPNVSPYYSNRGAAFQRRGNLDLARADYDRALAIDATNLDALILRGQYHALRNDFESAISDAKRRLSMRPDDPIAISWLKKWEADRKLSQPAPAGYVNVPVGTQAPQPAATSTPAIGMAAGLPSATGNSTLPTALATTNPVIAAIDQAFAAKQYAEMYRLASDGFEKQPSSEPLGFRKARALYYLKRDNESLAAVESLIATFPQAGESYNLRGVIRKSRSQCDAAIPDFEKAIELSPKHPFAYRNLALCFIAIGRLPAAIKQLELANAVAPTVATIATHILLLVNSGDAARAETIVAQGERARLDVYSDFLAARGSWRAARGLLADAHKDLDLALKADPTQTDALRAKAQLYERGGQYEASIALLRKVESDPDNASSGYQALATKEIARLEGMILARAVIAEASREVEAGRNLEAVEKLTKQIEKTPDIVDLYLMRGSVFSGLSRVDASLADFDKAIMLSPKNGHAYAVRALQIAGLPDRSQAAQADIDKALALNPKNVTALLAQTLVYLRQKEPLRAITIADRILKVEPKSEFALIYRATAETALEHYDKAMDDLNIALEFFPKSSNVLFLRGEINTRNNRLAEAIRDYSEALTQAKTKTPSMFVGRAKAYEKAGDNQKAIEDLEAAS
jgi:tetratricopeptide (TPR) repeat protein